MLLLVGLCVAIPSLIATILSNNQANKQNKENAKLTLYRIDKLEEKVNRHNNLIDRMYKIENRVTILEDEIKK